MVERAITEATSRIQKLAATDPGGFAAVLREAFGLRLGPEVERDLLEKAAHRQLPFPGRILFVPADVLPHAAAAYARENGGVIFLSARFRTDAPALAALILHEWGHHLDAILGPGESPREEGEIFFLGINHGAPIPAALPHPSGALASSHAVIQLEGRTIPVECWNLFTAIKSGFKKAADWTGGAVADATDWAADGLDYVADKGGGFLENTGGAAVNAVKGVAQGIAADVLDVLGDKTGAATLRAASEDSFNSAADNLKGAGNNVLDVAATAGELYNQVKTELDKTGLPLGTIVDIGAGWTPMAPYLAAVKGIADIQNAIENGGDVLAAVAAATTDVTLSIAGRTAKGIKAAKGPAPNPGLTDKIGGFFEKFKTVLLRGKNTATPGEINLGLKLITDYPEVVKVVKTLDKLRKAKTAVKVGSLLDDAGLLPQPAKDAVRETVNTLPGLSSVVALVIPTPTPDPAQPLVDAEVDRVARHNATIAENKKAISDIHAKAKADAHTKELADAKAKADADAKARRAKAREKADADARARAEEDDYDRAVQQANKRKQDEDNRRRREEIGQAILDGLNQVPPPQPQPPQAIPDGRGRGTRPQPQATPCDDCPGGKYDKTGQKPGGG